MCFAAEECQTGWLLNTGRRGNSSKCIVCIKMPRLLGD